MRLSLFWRVFAVNAGLLGGIALLLLLSPVEIDAPIKARQALIVVGVLVITLATNAALLRDAFAPLERLARRMDTAIDGTLAVKDGAGGGVEVRLEVPAARVVAVT